MNQKIKLQLTRPQQSFGLKNVFFYFFFGLFVCLYCCHFEFIDKTTLLSESQEFVCNLILLLFVNLSSYLVS